jgi:hypothetical protein
MNSSINRSLYALAREVISGRIGVLSGQLSRERSRPDRNDALCAEIRESVAQLFLEREALSSIDRAPLEKAIRKHARSITGAEAAIAAISDFHQGSENELH